MENTNTIKREGIMTKPFNVNRKVAKIALAVITILLIAMGAYFLFVGSVKLVEGKLVQLIQSDNSEMVLIQAKK